jgi:hypothetical protein
VNEVTAGYKWHPYNEAPRPVTMSVNKPTYLLHLRVFLSFLRIIRGFDYPGKYISQPTRIIGSLLHSI